MREGALKEAASEEITRGTHLTAEYPALFNISMDFYFNKKKNFTLK